MPEQDIEPDTKDWTWVLEQACPDCGFDAAAVEVHELPARVGANAEAMAHRLDADDVRERPSPTTWSPLEYACHVRDVHRVFDGRVRLMQTEHDPLFANWDQDETAREGRYAEQQPTAVAAELREAADVVASTYADVTDWSRSGRRSNGSVFTTASLGRYHLHDVVHHAHDVGAG